MRRAAILIPPLFWALSLLAAQFCEPVFLRATTEDGWIENGQLVMFAGAVILSVSVSRALARQGHVAWAGAYAVLALALFWVTGEEISWGQRVFGFQTPDWVKGWNVQGEVNVHNLGGVTRALSRVMTGVLSALVPASLLSKRLDAARQERWALRLWMPHPVLVPSLLCVLSYPFIRQVYSWRNPDETTMSLVVSRLQEPRELILSAAIVVFLCGVRDCLKGHEFARRPG
jgi:hypothetical protein